MLKRLKLTNFKKHESLEMAFGDGLIALKGGNEAGKSTAIQAIAYALFGVKALPYPLEDVVTHGKPANTLKVVLDFVVDGVEYTITRGKAGAELVHPDGTVTGQNETANFIGKLLGTDAAVAPKLILANQNEIRGALAAGAKATTDLIERLAEFDQLDKLIDLIQHHLTTGSTTSAEAAVEGFQAQMDSLTAVEQPDLDGLRAVESGWQEDIHRMNQQASETTTLHREAAAALNTARQVNADIARSKQNLEAALARAADAVKELDTISVPKGPSEAALKKAAAEARKAEADLELEPVYRAVQSVLGLEPVYDGPFGTLESEIDLTRRKIQALKQEVSTAIADVRVQQALKIAGSCSLCGKDVGEVPEVVAKNAEIDKKISELQGKQAKLTTQIQALTKDEAELTGIKSLAKAAVSKAEQYAKHLDVNAKVTPPTLTWLGPTDWDAARTRLAEAKSKLDELQALEIKHQTAKARQDQAKKRVDAAKADVEHATQQLAGRTESSLADLEFRVMGLEQSAIEWRDKLAAAQIKLEQVRSATREAALRWENYLTMRSQVEGNLAKAKADLKALQFNNGLLKAVRTARPVIADKLWALVLGAVSKYFSEMRGERSLVTKTGDGFLVDGHSSGTLSGSTLDILGLAVRVALVKTFVPHAPLLVLDEPTAAMDAERTATTLGFLTQTGFRQTIIVSHEEATEAVADHLIQL